MEPMWRDRKHRRSTWRYGRLPANNDQHDTTAFIKALTGKNVRSVGLFTALISKLLQRRRCCYTTGAWAQLWNIYPLITLDLQWRTGRFGPVHKTFFGRNCFVYRREHSRSWTCELRLGVDSDTNANSAPVLKPPYFMSYMKSNISVALVV